MSSGCSCWPCRRHAPPQQELSGCETSKQWTIDRLAKNHFKLVGQVEVICGTETFFADEIETFTDENRLIATGNVVFTSGDSRIAAERLEFNTKTKTGTFYNAAGSAALQPTEQRPGEPAIDRSMYGTQEPDVYFYGDTVEKVGEKKYRITHGGFTTCVQPEPRWKLTSGTVHHPPRALRDPDQLALPGEGRAGAVPAGLLLPGAGRTTARPGS